MKTGKKIVAILLCLCTALTCFGYAFAADADEACTHEWIFDSICTIPEESHEFAVYHCKNCSSVHSVILHVWDAGSVEKEPTCTDDGQMVYLCMVGGCTETKTESIAALGHKSPKLLIPINPLQLPVKPTGKTFSLVRTKTAQQKISWFCLRNR